MIGSQYILVPERELAKVMWVRLSLDYKEPKTKKKKEKKKNFHPEGEIALETVIGIFKQLF